VSSRLAVTVSTELMMIRFESVMGSHCCRRSDCVPCRMQPSILMIEVDEALSAMTELEAAITMLDISCVLISRTVGDLDVVPNQTESIVPV
jgi:hypothetical protein